MCAVDKMVNQLADASNAYDGKPMDERGVDDVVSVAGLAFGILFARMGYDTKPFADTAALSDSDPTSCTASGTFADTGTDTGTDTGVLFRIYTGTGARPRTGTG